MSRGHDRERQVRRNLEAEDWFVCRAAGSLGDVDLVALKEGKTPMLIEVKSSAGGPYEHFRPADRADLVFAARLAGAQGVACPLAAPWQADMDPEPELAEG